MTDTPPAKEINPFLRQALELGPPIAFFVIYLRLRDQTFTWAGTEYSGFIVATLAFIPIMLVAMGILWKLTGQLSRIQIFTAVMVIFFGALTWWFNDEKFFKMKTTIVYGFFALLLAIGLVRGKSYLAYVLSDALPLTPEGWMTLTRRLAIMFLALAVTNEIIWRTLSTDLWVKIETFGFPIALFAFLWWQLVSLGAFEEDTPES
ncbi:inner membrane-spanning protein YciB [Pseudaestuariivita sp.]|uniref:inner membrane-spanning protein YciB n=1 Tax=Pseudaestuariivita sp. TaxID=2211669 RepID=UPI00405995C7